MKKLFILFTISLFLTGCLYTVETPSYVGTTSYSNRVYVKPHYRKRYRYKLKCKYVHYNYKKVRRCKRVRVRY